MNLVERFLKYVKMDTQSNPHSDAIPSSAKQLDLANVLVEDMKAMGIEDAHVDEYGIVYGSIPSNVEKEVDTIGFIAHMDTSPDMSGKDVQAKIVKNYDGGKIILNEKLGISMDTHTFPSLALHKGQDLIVTDGTTLLGADDKAGIAEILDMCQKIMQENIPHGAIKIAFTPDEEVGRGADHFNVKAFAADYAYTVDGGDIHSIDYENFNAASAVVNIKGSSIHPGEAKHKMINALHVAMQFHSLLPVKDDPALSEGYEGFNHLCEIQGGCEEAKMEYIIRNHDEMLFQKQKEDFIRATKFLNDQYGYEMISLDIQDSYANMRQLIEKRMDIVDNVKIAMKQIGLTPISTAIRGGTDGARLTYEGLLCPNIGTGGYNYHGKYEYVSIQSMHKISELLCKIVENNAK
ncbi:MAG: peptidase T [Erysipelotrichia bacterium]|nr:peptidase T [Erysipelotrichia bacterium]NCC54429.1 peptidase T [Erysipelotrichia bacterium]